MRQFMENYMEGQRLTQPRIKEILDQDIPRFEETTQYLERYVKKSSKILDISRASGWESTYGAYLKSIGYNVDYFGNDDVRFKFNIPDNSYEAVLVLELFEHLNPLSNRNDYNDLMKDARIFLKECKRILRPQGYLLLTTPNITDYAHIRALIEGKEPYYLYHFREFSPNTISYELHQTGFNVIQVDTIVNKSDPQVESMIKQLGGRNQQRGKHILAIAIKEK